MTKTAAPTLEERQEAIDVAFQPLNYERALEMAVYHGEQRKSWLEQAKALKGAKG